MAICPQCSNKVAEIYPVASDIRIRIKQKEPNYQVLDEVCRSCMNSLRKRVYGAGTALMADEVAKDERKKKMWQSRVALVRRGHALMENQLYAEAAATYEKYLRLLELVFDCKQGELTPEALKESAKTAELTVIVGVYWDLLRIYDTSDNYTDRQKNASEQLARFINYTPVFADILKKAESYVKNSKHPDIVRIFINSAKKKRTRCFIATSAFEIPASSEVQLLREFRDQVLKKRFLGRKFVYFYYRVSPSIAKWLDHSKTAKAVVRFFLRQLVRFIR
jgi:hypothetical protein